MIGATPDMTVHPVGVVGEEMERIVSSDPSFVACVNAWSGSES